MFFYTNYTKNYTTIICSLSEHESEIKWKYGNYLYKYHTKISPPLSLLLGINDLKITCVKPFLAGGSHGNYLLRNKNFIIKGYYLPVHQFDLFLSDLYHQ